MSMSEDRDLLLMAAKAAGHEGDYVTNGCDDRGQYCGIRTNPNYIWNPLVEDNDALQLAVKLEINVLPMMEVCSARNPSYTGWINENGSRDPYAATRRAIVRAAAEIGKAMP